MDFRETATERESDGFLFINLFNNAYLHYYLLLYYIVFFRKIRYTLNIEK